MSRVNEVLSSVKKTTNIYFVRHSKYWKDSEFVTKARLKLTDKVEALMITGPGLVAYKQPFSTNFSKDVVERPLMVTLNQLKHIVGKG